MHTWRNFCSMDSKAMEDSLQFSVDLAHLLATDKDESRNQFNVVSSLIISNLICNFSL